MRDLGAGRGLGPGPARRGATGPWWQGIDDAGAGVADFLVVTAGGSRTDYEPAWSGAVDETAKLMNVSERMVHNARAVRRRGTPEEIAAMEKGDARPAVTPY